MCILKFKFFFSLVFKTKFLENEYNKVYKITSNAITKFVENSKYFIFLFTYKTEIK